MSKCIMILDNLNSEIKEVFGCEYMVNEIVTLVGGAQKGTFKVSCNNDLIFTLYIWDKYYDYFYDDNNKDNDFTSNSAILFSKNSDMLKKNDIRSPKIYHLDITKLKYSHEFAFVEYINSIDLETTVANSEEKYYDAFKDLQKNLYKLHNITNDKAGELYNLKDDSFKCEEYIYDLMQKDLKELCESYEPINRIQTELNKVIYNMYRSIKSRKKYSLIHWELGPNHVLVDKNNKSYLIDIEGMKFFDLEYEHSFLKFRFGDFYEYFKREDLDEDRMRFYKLYHHLASASGAHELLKHDYDEKLEVESMIKYNCNEILKFVGN